MNSFRSLCGLLITLALLSTSELRAQGFNFDVGESIGQAASVEAAVAASLEQTPDSGVVLLKVTLTIPPGANTYSQDPKFAKPTKIVVKAPAGLSPLGENFTPDHPPKVAFDDNFGKEVEKFTGSVTFSRRFLLPQGVDITTAELTGSISFLLCDKNSCQPKVHDFVATLQPASAGTTDVPAVPEELAAPEAVTDSSAMPAVPEELPALPETVAATAIPLTQGYTFTPQRDDERDPVRLTVWLHPANAPVGETVTLNVRMDLDEEWRTYGLEKANATQVELPTVLTLGELQNLAATGNWLTSPAPSLHQTDVGTSAAHEHAVTWSQPLKVTGDGPLGLTGTIRYQLCKETCFRPLTVPFSLGESQQAADVALAIPLASLPQEHASNSNGSENGSGTGGHNLEVAPTKVAAGGLTDLQWVLLVAFFGGMLLNVMPCVLPVLAIKILSFVQQAGESRQRILLLNVCYTIGVLGVFLALATLSVVASQAFGDLFQDEYFNLAMILVVFAMGLSLLGVFELPISGILPSASSHQEGLMGAFWTGVIATLLATPCTAGVMVTPLAFLKDQPPSMSFLVFGLMGLGMAFPYLLAGFFPKIVRLIPKPGEWMVKFKQFCGFVLLGTVIFLMDSIDDERLLGTCILLLGVALALWMLFNLTTPLSSMSAKIRNVVLTVLVCGPVIAFGLQPKHEATPFSEARMIELREQGKPMLIDFTADWCGVCKTNELLALNRKETHDFLREHHVEFMVADFTKEDPEIRKWLNEFGQDSVPLTVIVPPDNKPLILLSGAFTQSMLLEKLREAMGTEPQHAAAMLPDVTSAAR